MKQRISKTGRHHVMQKLTPTTTDEKSKRGRYKKRLRIISVQIESQPIEGPPYSRSLSRGILSSLFHPSVSFVSPSGRQLTTTLPLEGSPPRSAACVLMMDCRIAALINNLISKTQGLSRPPATASCVGQSVPLLPSVAGDRG